MDILIRDMTVDDVPRVEWSGGPRHLEYLTNALNNVQSGKSDFLCVVYDGEIISYGGINYDTTPGAGHMTMLIVREDQRNQGIGQELIASLEARIVSKGIEAVELSVESDNALARRLYERLGYVVTRSDKEQWEEDSPGGGVRMHHADVFVMEKFLEPPFKPELGRP